MLSDSYFEHLLSVSGDNPNVSSVDEENLAAAQYAKLLPTASSLPPSTAEDDYLVTEELLDDVDSNAEAPKADETNDDEKETKEDKDDTVKTDDKAETSDKDTVKEESNDTSKVSNENAADKPAPLASETTEDEGMTLKELKKVFGENDEIDELVAQYGYDKIFDAIDENGDGLITDEELKNLDLSTDKIEDLTTDDIKKIAKAAGLPEIEEDDSEEDGLSDELLQKLKDAFLNDNSDTETQAVTPSSGTGGVSGAGGVSGGGGSGGYGNSSSGSGTSTDAATTPDEMSMDELLSKQAEKQGEIDTAAEDVVAVQSGENEAVAAAKQDADEKQEIYEKALEEDEEVSEELKTRQKENQEAITEKEEQITEQETIIAESDNTIADCDSQISIIDSEISALNASKNALPAKTDDNESQHADIDAMAQQIESKIKDAESRKEALEEDKEEAQDAKDDAEEKLDTYTDELDELEAERDEIEKEILKTCSDETKKALEEWQEARENIETVKSEELEKAQSNLETLRGELEEINTSIKELQEMQIQLENRVGGEGEDVVAFAEKLDGLSASEMKQIMQAAGCQFDDGAWCADFCTYVTKQVYGNDATPGDFASSCSNTAYCPTIANWAESKGVLTTDSSQVQPGDFILYNRNGRYSHIGIVTSVNSDGTVNTIEGNTSDDNGNYTNGVVNTHSNRTGTYVLMSKLA